jgi:hypothetical protein
MAGLCDAGLVEKRQFWFAGKNILHVRPLATVSNFLGSAVCWDAADEFVHNWRAAKQFGIPEHWSLWERPNLESCKLAELSSANQQSSNIISNELKIEHTNKHAHSATPPCAVKPGSSQNKSKIPGGMKPITSLIRYWLNINNIGSAAGLDAKTACALVEFYKGLRLLNSQGKYVDLRPYAKDILWFKWEKEPHWKVSKKADLGPAWNAAKKTFPAHLVDHISESAMQWEVAGRPKRHLMQGWD